MNAADEWRRLRALREQPPWRLLAADEAPAVLAVLCAVFGANETALPVSLLQARLARELDSLRDAGEHSARSASQALVDWLRAGWLVRRAERMDGEEALAPSDAALAALHFTAQGLAAPPAGADGPACAAPGSSPKPDTAPPAEPDPTPRQLDIFADSDDVRRRNDFTDALLAGDAPLAGACLQAWREANPGDALLPDAARLLERLQEDAASAAGPGAAPVAALLGARTRLEGEVARAARALLGDAAAPAWLAGRWRVLAERARHIEWQPASAEVHAAALWLRAGDWAAAQTALASIESWRRIPQPLLWMAQARWHLEGTDAAWPLLAEAFWLAPARARALLFDLADRRLKQVMQRFEDDFEIVDDDGDDGGGREDWAWWPAWLAVEQPLLAEVLARAEDLPERAAAQGFRLVAALLRLEHDGRHHEIVAARKRLQALEPRLFTCYMRTR
jgi:hypothetical protein